MRISETRTKITTFRFDRFSTSSKYEFYEKYIYFITLSKMENFILLYYKIGINYRKIRVTLIKLKIITFRKMINIRVEL